MLGTHRSVVILRPPRRPKNLSSALAPKKEGFFVARKNQGARFLRAALLRMTELLARLQKNRSLARPNTREQRVRASLGMTALSSVALAFILPLAFANPAAAGTVTGVVRNGTDGKIAAGVDVILIQLQGGMQPVANTKSDDQGAYKFDFPSIGQQPMLIRAVYHGVMFHQPLPPGRNTADVTVYEPSADSKMVNVGSRVIVLQPNGENLLVGEEYALQNQSQPPRAYYAEKGDFAFQLPQGAQLGQVSSWGPSGMPVVQGTMDKGKGKYAIAYAFQPGDNGVRLSYQLPYPSNHADLRLTSDYSVGRVMLVAPPSVTLKSDGFTPAGTEQGFSLYTRDSVPAGLPFDVSVSGTAPAPQASQRGNDQDPSVNSRANETIQALPNRLDSLRWIIVGGFAALVAIGLLLLWRQPVIAPAAGAGAMPAPPNASAGPRKRKGSGVAASSATPAAATPARAVSPSASPLASAKPAAPSASATAVAEPVSAPAASAGGVESEVQNPGPPTSAGVAGVGVENSLDNLKDKLFRLELRRQAGTISEEDYGRERARTEAILRELVRG